MVTAQLKATLFSPEASANSHNCGCARTCARIPGRQASSATSTTAYIDAVAHSGCSPAWCMR